MLGFLTHMLHPTGVPVSPTATGSMGMRKASLQAEAVWGGAFDIYTILCYGASGKAVKNIPADWPPCSRTGDINFILYVALYILVL